MGTSLHNFISMFKYTILFISLITLASCSNTQANPSSTVKTTGNTTLASKKSIEKVLYVDVREDEEWAAGHIE